MTRTSTRRSTITTATRLSSSLEEQEGGVADQKRLFQRIFYRFSPGSEVDQHNAIVVEERVRFINDPDKGGDYILPVGPRTLILRDGSVEDGEIGDDFFSLNVHDREAVHSGAGNDIQIESAIATAMYVASNPDLVTGKVLEVACSQGVAGLLGSIGAAYVLNKKKEKGGGDAAKSDADEILTVPKEKNPLLPEDLKELTLTDTDEENLNMAVQNVKESGATAAQVVIAPLDWSSRSPAGTRKRQQVEYDTILGADVAFSYPEAKELARTVANALGPANDAVGKSAPRFVHVCPDEREDAPYLQRFLSKGYRMNTRTGYLMVEKLTFGFQTLLSSAYGSLLADETAALDELDGEEGLDVKQFKELSYQSLTATHDTAYVGGGSGELFFPMETGEYDASSGSTYLERDSSLGGNDMNPFN